MNAKPMLSIVLSLACLPAAAQHVHGAPKETTPHDHAGMQQAEEPAKPASAPAAVHAHAPAVSAADRAAAFPAVHHAHHQHGTRIVSFSLVDRLEVSKTGGAASQAWEARGWIGGDVQKLVWRTEGHAHDGRVERASVEALYGRGVDAWWDVVAGVRQDLGEGPGRTWAAVGVQGVAPYMVEVAATAYFGPSGRTALQGEAEYDTRLTNRLILQWRAEAQAFGKADPALGIGAGLTSSSVGARLRYEVDRQFAPYIGIEHERRFGRTARWREQAGGDRAETRWVAGLRFWF